MNIIEEEIDKIIKENHSVLPCGCVIGMINDVFYVTPCSIDCGSYYYALEVMLKYKKPIYFVNKNGVN